MKLLEKQLKDYGKKVIITSDKNLITQTVIRSIDEFYDNLKNHHTTYFEFLYQQAGYIKKRWWIYQMLILVLTWIMISTTDSNYVIQRSMGVLAPVFVILIVPEIWKNRTSSSMEIEGTAFYSLRQIYAARMLLFAIIDVLLLGIFYGMVFITTDIKIDEILIHFILPLTVTCCICFRTLCSKYLYAEYYAVTISFFWIAIWTLIVRKESIYSVISMPLWIGIICLTIIYLVYAIRKVLKECENYWEGNISWN